MTDSAIVHLESLAAVREHVHRTVDAFALLRRCDRRPKADGSHFYSLELCDRTATVRGVVWPDAEGHGEVEALGAWSAVKVRAGVQLYQDAPQLVVQKIREIGPGDDCDRTSLWGEVPDWVPSAFCRTLVFDIETVPAHELRGLPQTIVKALSAQAERQEMDEAAVMGLSPYFGKVVSVAFGDGELPPDEQTITALVVPPDDAEREWPDWIRPLSEPEILRTFWALAGAADLVVTYNGRGFDLPFLAARSLVHRVPVMVDLLSSRYSLRPHLDLYDVLGQRGRGPSNLDVVCWALGIQSPKGAMDGSMVAPAYARGEIVEIARYNREDVRATTAVYQRVRNDLLQYRADF